MTKTRLPQRRLRLAFFGTPNLARHILDAMLLADDDDVCLVICQPDKPRGRNKTIQSPPVKILGEEKGIEVIQPKKMKDGTLAAYLAQKNLDLAIVAAYGRILTSDTLEAIPAGFWNIHTSILPRHRGASPIQHALLAGDSETGVALMQMTEGCDEGPVLALQRTPIDKCDTCNSLTERLVKIAGPLVVDSLRTAKSEGLIATEQGHDQATYTRLLTKADGCLDFKQTAAELDRRVRALNPWPGTFVQLESGQTLKIVEAQGLASNTQATIGTIVHRDKTLHIQTKHDALEILRVQAPGKKPMATQDYLRGAGRHWQMGDSFGCIR